MQHLLTILNKAEPQRLAKAAAGLADACLTVKLVYHDQDGIRATVQHGREEYRVMLNAEASFCSCKDSFYRCGLSDQPAYCKHRLAVALYALGHQPKKTENAPSAAEPEQGSHLCRPDNLTFCGREKTLKSWAWAAWPSYEYLHTFDNVCPTCVAIVFPRSVLISAANTDQDEAAV